MKATIDFEERLYRRLKIEAARRGRTIRELVEDGVRYVLDLPQEAPVGEEQSTEPKWFGSLNKYAANASGRHDLAAMRASIAAQRNTRR